MTDGRCDHGDVMMDCPCTMSTLSKIANDINDALIARAAGVILKENAHRAPYPL